MIHLVPVPPQKKEYHIYKVLSQRGKVQWVLEQYIGHWHIEMGQM